MRSCFAATSSASSTARVAAPNTAYHDVVAEVIAELRLGLERATQRGIARDKLWIDTWGSPMSDAGKMTEKFRRPNFGTLEIELTIDDPKTYTGPFTVNLRQSIEPDTELVDEFCLEGEKDYDRLQRSRGK